MRWREQTVPGAGLWVDLGSHLLDQAVQLFGRPDTLQLDTAPLRDGALVEDYFHAVLRYDSGPHAPLRVVLHATTLAADPAPRYILHGTRGSYVKHGVDPQEDAAARPASGPAREGWGADRGRWPAHAGRRCRPAPEQPRADDRRATTCATTPRSATRSAARARIR